MSDYLDLMAFARGAETANKANWQDTIYDINTRAAEENLRQSQTNFDLKLPGMQFGAEAEYGAKLGNRNAAEFETGVFTEAMKLPQEQQNPFIVETYRRRLQNLDPTAPGASAESVALRDMVKLRATSLLKTNPEAAAQMFDLFPGVGGYVEATRDLAKWSDPKVATDPINLLEAANSIGATFDQASNSYQIPGTNTRLNAFELINIKREQAQNKLANVTPQLQRNENVQNSINSNTGIMEQLRSLGISASVNPNNGGLEIIGRYGQPQQPTVELPAYTGLPQASTIPGLRASINPLAGTRPVFDPQVLAAETQRDVAPPALRMPALNAQPALSVPPALSPPVAAPQMSYEQAGSVLDNARALRSQLESNPPRVPLSQRTAPGGAYQQWVQAVAQARADEQQAFAQYQRSLTPAQTSSVQSSGWITRR